MTDQWKLEWPPTPGDTHWTIRGAGGFSIRVKAPTTTVCGECQAPRPCDCPASVQHATPLLAKCATCGHHPADCDCPIETA